MFEQEVERLAHMALDLNHIANGTDYKLISVINKSVPLTPYI